MKFVQYLLASALFILPVLTAAAAGGKHDLTPRHGGMVVEAGHLDVELVAKAAQIKVYLRDHDKPVKLDGASGKLTLLDGGGKTEVPLQAAGDALEATATLKAGAKAVVLIMLPGKAPFTARFTLR